MTTRSHQQVMIGGGGFDTTFPSVPLIFSTTFVANDTITPGSGAWSTGRSITSHPDGSGLFQAECVAVGGANNHKVFGVLDNAITNGNSFIGGLFGGNDAGYQCSNALLTEGNFSNPGTTGGAITINGGSALLVINMTTRKFWVKLSSTGLFIGGGDPLTDTNPTFTWSSALRLHIGCSVFNGSPVGEARLNTGAAPFITTPIPGVPFWG